MGRAPLVVEIDRVVLHGTNVSPEEGARFREHLAREIERLLARDGLGGPVAAHDLRRLDARPMGAALGERQLAATVAERVAGVVKGQLR